jgi:hypothetical protein
LRPLGERVREHVANHDVRLDQPQLWSELGVSVEIVQELNQYQLCIWHRIDPQFDPLALLAEFDQSEPLPADCAATTPVEKIQPIRDRGILFRRARGQQHRKLRIRRQRPPNEAKTKGNDDVGETCPHESTRTGVARRQD